MIKIGASLTEKNVLMLNTIKEHYGIRSDSEAVRWIITQTYEKLISPTRYGKTNRLDPVNENTNAEKICSMLDGEVIDGSCRYVKYDMLNPHTVMEFPVTRPLERLSQKDLETQYVGGSKIDIAKIIMKKKQDAEHEASLQPIRETAIFTNAIVPEDTENGDHV